MKEELSKYIRAADYLAAAQIYLRDNFLLEKPLEPEHLKPRLLGHWGTCPGINFTYAHLNRAIKEHNLNALFVLGPGHGFPAIQANLFLEGTLSKYYEDITRDAEGMEKIIGKFSWPYGFPSHSNPEAPGVILEGGELGYSLATSYGAVLDNPDMIACCMVGDGEAETAPIAAAWHLSKLIDPATNGAVLPIVHINGYKISGPTFYGRMSDEELTHLFLGYGYDPIFVNSYTSEDIHQDMIDALDKAVNDIHFTQHLAREGSMTKPPRWPVIILRTPKGWHSIDYVGDKKIENNHYSHQVIADGAHSDPDQLDKLEHWLRSYRFDELFDKQTGFIQEIEDNVPAPERRMGDNPHTMGGEPGYRPLKLPELTGHSLPSVCHVDDSNCMEESSMERIGAYLRDVMALNAEERNIRLFSPDETYSNKLQAVFEVTKRGFVWPKENWDKDLAWDGRVLEMLSEHSLQGMLQGYVLTGRHGVFASYEAFIQVVASMADQYAKFISIARQVPFRKTIPSLNYILTSSGWRQEHNGFSHQNPGFIDGVLQRQGCFTNVYLPADANTALAVFKRMMESTEEINVLACGKRPNPCWRTAEEAQADVEAGISIWDFASDENPHVVMAAAGDYVTKEALAAVSIIKKIEPKIKVRFVNITSLSALGLGHTGCTVTEHDVEHYFTKDKPVHINFHGYPQTIKQILFDYGETTNRFKVHGYEEIGSTTTPFDMMVRNRTDRYTLAKEMVEDALAQKVITKKRAKEITDSFNDILKSHREYVIKNGDDPREISHWVWDKS